MEELWARSRQGSHAGRGFHYQNAVAAEMAVRAWRGELLVRRFVPEGLEDISLELDDHWLHLQAKSRREHRGNFTPGELASAWRHLAERLAADPTAHGALVLERPLEGAESGLDRTLAEVAHPEIRKAIALALAGLSFGAEEFLSRMHMVVLPALATTSIALLADKLGLPPATCVAHYTRLRTELSRLADENGIRGVHDPAAFTVGEIARLIDDVSEAVDASALEEAVRDGLCELVDFSTPLVDPRFFQGVDVVVGHIVAGLPAERPELADELIAGLLARRVALAVGPSGAGKSAILWMVAHDLRHRVRWYRTRRLAADDVPAFVRLVKGLQPTPESPIGLVVDDLGRDDRTGFDQLVEELREQPGALVLGACREEDLILVRTAHQAAQVRPTLDVVLAERIWAELRARGETAWAEWREPYERSERLLLEYGHLLTAGRRLAETICGQIEQRVLDNRGLELDVLALVATADAYGAELDATKLAAALNADDTRLKSALLRLVDEHLISLRDGMLGGLHELRSLHATQAIHRVPPPTLGATVRRVIDLLDGPILQRFVTRLLLAEAVEDDQVIDALAARATSRTDPRGLAAALHALRLVGFQRSAAQWREAFLDEDASPTNIGIIAQYVLNGGEAAALPQPTQRVIARLRALGSVDLRPVLLARIAPQVPAALAAAPDIETAATLLAALGEIGQQTTAEGGSLAPLAEGASLADLRLLLEAAYAASPELAVDLVDKLGGAAALLERLEAEQAWVRAAHLGATDDGRPTAEAEYAYVAESAQPPAHDAVVDLARYLAAFAPTAEVAICRAIDATGAAAGFGLPLADKAIDRCNLPSQAAIAWNRARGRAAIAALAAPTETDYLLGVRDIMVQAAPFVRRMGDAWARGRSPNSRLAADAAALAEAAHKLRPAPIAIETAGVLDEGELPFLDAASYVGTMIANNLYGRLFKGEHTAPLIPQIIDKVEEWGEPDRWRFLGEAPLDDVAALRQALLDLYAVASEEARSDRLTRVALQVAAQGGLASAAKEARKRSSARMELLSSTTERRMAQDGFHATVVRRTGPAEPHRWPNDDFLVLVTVPTILDWLINIEALVSLCRPLLADLVHLHMAPVRAGRIVASCGVRVIENVFPDDCVRSWPELPFPLLDEALGDRFRRGTQALCEISGIVSSIRGARVHGEEVAALEAAFDRARETLGYLDELESKGGDELITEIHATFVHLSQIVGDEAFALERGEQTTSGLAASMIAGLRGEGDSLFLAQIGAAAACAEWDVDPEGAWLRVQEIDTRQEHRE